MDHDSPAPEQPGATPTPNWPRRALGGLLSGSRRILAVICTEKARNLLVAARDSAAIIALLIGAVWTIRQQQIFRQTHAVVTIEHRISHIRLNPEKVLLIVDIDLRNAGKVLVHVENYWGEALQILPLLPAEDKRAAALDAKYRRNVPWPGIEKKKEVNDERQLEPGETEPLHYEFVIDSSMKVIGVHSFFANSDDKDNTPEHPSGWQRFTTYDLETSSVLPASKPTNSGLDQKN